MTSRAGCETPRYKTDPIAASILVDGRTELARLDFGQRIRVGDQEPDVQAVGERPLPRNLDQPCAPVDPRHPCAASRQLARVTTFATPDVENRFAGDVLKHRQDARHQVLVTVIVGVRVRDPVVRNLVPCGCRGIVSLRPSFFIDSQYST